MNVGLLESGGGQLESGGGQWENMNEGDAYGIPHGRTYSWARVSTGRQASRSCLRCQCSLSLPTSMCWSPRHQRAQQRADHLCFLMARGDTHTTACVNQTTAINVLLHKTVRATNLAQHVREQASSYDRKGIRQMQIAGACMNCC